MGMNIMNCKSGMKVTTNKNQPAYIGRRGSMTCCDEDVEGYLTVGEVDNDQAVIMSKQNSVTFFIMDLSPYFGGKK
jgi:hypothetical protein